VVFKNFANNCLGSLIKVRNTPLNIYKSYQFTSLKCAFGG